MRRRAILSAARSLLAEVATDQVSLTALALRSGISKANVYRYFESREEVLLQVWVEEVRELTRRLEADLATVPTGDVDGVSEVIVAAFEAQPKLCELTSIVSPVLERNLSAEAILSAKQTLAELTLQLGRLLHERLPAVSFEDCCWVSGVVGVYVAGVWPAVHPPAAAKEVLARPELAAMQPDFKRDLKRLLQVVFTGLVFGARLGRPRQLPTKKSRH